LLIAQAFQLVHELVQRAVGYGVAYFRISDERSTEEIAVYAAVSAVSVTLLFTQIGEQASGRSTTQDAIGNDQGDVVGICDAQRESAGKDVALYRAGTIDQIDLGRSWSGNRG